MPSPVKDRPPGVKRLPRAVKRLVPVGKRLVPVGKRLLPVGKRLLPVGKRMLPVTKRLFGSRLVRWGFVAVAVGLGGYAVAGQWTGIRRALAQIGPLPVAGSMLAVLLGLLATMCAWRRLLAGLGSPLPTPPAARILFLGQLGKYLPGSVWPILAQMELGRAHRIPRHHSASASVLTMLLSLLTGLITALVMLPFTGASSYLWAFAAAPVLLACLHPRVLNPLMGRLLRLARQPPLDQPLSGRTLAVALGWSFAAWVCNGVQIWLLAVRLGAPADSSLLLATGGYAFAWSVGFLVVFAPAGVGVREVLLVATLSPAVGTGAATAVALVSRALTTAGDLVTAAVAGGYQRRPQAGGLPADAGTAPDAGAGIAPDAGAGIAPDAGAGQAEEVAPGQEAYR
jgi:glycosyltransferase 2 family protein